MSDNEYNEYYDVCVICALYEEAQAFLDILTKHGAEPVEKFSKQLQRNFFHATIQNNAGEPLTLFITWAPDMGGSDISTELERILQVFPVRFAAMTGLCAGNKDRVKLGDLIVAESTYLHDGGSYISTTNGTSKHLFNVRTLQVSQTILQAVRGFDEWQEEGLQLKRPASKRQQTDWLLNTLLEKKSIPSIDRSELNTHAPQWRDIIQELKQGEKPFLNAKLQLNEELITDLLYGPEDFPYRDPSAPMCHIGTIATGNSVRKDDPFPEISLPVNKVLALDMECWAFYHTLRARYDVHALFVKGVCDYGDGNKDDTYHEYASTLSAIYMHTFIKKFVTEQRMPRPRVTQQPSSSTPSRPAPTKSSSTSNNSAKPQGNQPVKVFFSYSQSPADEKLIKDINKHFFPLQRDETIKSWYRNDVYAGDTVEKEVEEKLNEAQIIILLLTPDYLSSPLYDRESVLIEKRAEEGAIVIPVLLRAVSDRLWKREFYGGNQPIPRHKPAIASWSNQDEAMVNVVNEIATVIEKLFNP